MPVKSLGLLWSCDNFTVCGTPAVQSDGLPPGWSDNQLNGQRVVLCQVDTPQIAKTWTGIPVAITATTVQGG